MEIAKNAFMEKIRRKELYIVSIIGVLIVILFGTGAGTITIEGKSVTDYTVLAPIMLFVVNIVCCILSSIMSISTIPNEYERKTSHLIWCRGVSQGRYHMELTFANILIGMVSEAILFCAIAVFMVSHGHAEELWRLLPSYLIMAINVFGVGVMTSALTIVMPRVFAGALGVGITILGSVHGLLEMIRDILGGFAGGLLGVVLKVVPNYSEVGKAAGNIIAGNETSYNTHTILEGLVVIYIFTIAIMVIKRREA